MNDETQPPFTRKGIRLGWTTVGQILLFLSPFVLAGTVAYMSTIFARHEDMAPLQALPSRVERLEEFKVEQKMQQNSTNATMGAMQQDLAGLKAQINGLKEESSKNTDRILQRLDSLQRKQ